MIFQPTRPLRGATVKLCQQAYDYTDISTHAPLAGRDNGYYESTNKGLDFNPRAPCGARRLSLLPQVLPLKISTHAPLAGRDYPFSYDY